MFYAVVDLDTFETRCAPTFYLGLAAHYYTGRSAHGSGETAPLAVDKARDNARKVRLGMGEAAEPIGLAKVGRLFVPPSNDFTPRGPRSGFRGSDSARDVSRDELDDYTEFQAIRENAIRILEDAA